MKSPLFPNIKDSDKELRKRVMRQMKKAYPLASGDIQRRVAAELDEIIDAGIQCVFLLTKEWMDAVNLKPSDVVFSNGFGYDSVVCYLLGLTDMDPMELEEYYPRRSYSSIRKCDAHFEIEIPKQKKSIAMKALKKLPGVKNVIVQGEDTYYLVPEGVKANRYIGVREVGGFLEAKEEVPRGLHTPFIKFVIRENWHISIISDLRSRTHLEKEPFKKEQLNKTIKWIVDTASGRFDSNGTTLISLPLVQDYGICERIGGMQHSQPKDIYDFTRLIMVHLMLDDVRYTAMLGLTIVAVRMAYFKAYYPNEYYEAYIEEVASEEVKNVINKGIKAISRRIDELEDEEDPEYIIPISDEASSLFLAEEKYNRDRDLSNRSQDRYAGPSKQVPPESIQAEEKAMTRRGAVAQERFKQLKTKIARTIIGNDELVSALTLAITSTEKGKRYNDVTDDIKYPRQILLIIGGTGTGKTFTVKTAAEAADRAFININLAELSAVGYVGKDLATALGTAALGIRDDKLQRAVFFLDELDKVILGEKTRTSERTFDMVPEILKLIENDTMMLKTGENSYKSVPIQDAIFVFAGAFEDVNSIILDRVKCKRTIGFAEGTGAANNDIDFEKKDDNILTKVTTEDLEQYGVSRQLLGRMSRIVITKPMTLEGYKNILMQSSDSAVLKHKRLLSDVYGIDLSFTDEAIDAIAAKCEEKKVGARGLNTIVNTVVSKALADAIQQGDTSCILILPDENGGVKYELKMSPDEYCEHTIVESRARGRGIS